MAYASLSDVQALNSARVYTASSQPATSQVGLFLDNKAAEIDSILVEKGYSLPVPSTASSALLFLRNLNALGAWADVEVSAPASPNKDIAQAMWSSSLDMLKAAQTILDIPKNQTRSGPRGPGVTVPPITDQPYDPLNTPFDANGNPADSGQPFFVRSYQF
jgi:hypothetical protein